RSCRWSGSIARRGPFESTKAPPRFSAGAWRGISSAARRRGPDVLKETYETVLVQKDDGITWVTFNRPEKRNAMSPALHYEMAEIIDELELDPDTGVVVLTGAGDSFTAGFDLREYMRNLEGKPVEKARAKRAAQHWT